MQDWASYDERDPETGLYGYWENPNARWDWYVLGDRFSGSIRLKPGGKGSKGRPDVFDNQTGMDQALKGHIANLDELATYTTFGMSGSASGVNIFNEVFRIRGKKATAYPVLSPTGLFSMSDGYVHTH